MADTLENKLRHLKEIQVVKTHNEGRRIVRDHCGYHPIIPDTLVTGLCGISRRKSSQQSPIWGKKGKQTKPLGILKPGHYMRFLRREVCNGIRNPCKITLYLQLPPKEEVLRQCDKYDRFVATNLTLWQIGQKFCRPVSGQECLLLWLFTIHRFEKI